MTQSRAPQQGGGQITLAQINEMLNSAGFPIINPERIETLQSLAPRERIIRAIRLAKTDTGARSWLTDLFERAGIALQQPAQRPAPQQQAQQPHNDYQSSQASADDAAYQDSGQGYESHRQHQQAERPRAPQQQRGYDQRQQGQSRGHQAQSRGQQYPQNNREGGARVNPEDRMSVHVYGGKGALCFETDVTKAKVHTISLDAAPSTGPRQYDWNNKIRLQMTRAELPVVLAVLIGALPACEFKNHGQDNTKGFSMARQEGGKVFVKVSAKDQGQRAVPIMPADVFYVASLFIRQLRKEHPWLDTTGLMSLVRATQSGAASA